MISRKLNKLHEQEVIGMSKLAVVLCPDSETQAGVERVYKAERGADEKRWSTVSLLAVRVNWEASGIPNAIFCHCLGSVNYIDDEIWTAAQLKPMEVYSEERDAKSYLYESELFCISRDNLPGATHSTDLCSTGQVQVTDDV